MAAAIDAVVTAANMRAIASLLGLFVMASSSPVSAITLCRAKSGALVLRETCKRREASVNLEQLGVGGAAGPTGAQGPAGPAGPTGSQGSQGVQGPPGEVFVARDATGTVIGKIVDVVPDSGDAVVARRVGGALLTFVVRAQSLAPSGGAIGGGSETTLYYESADCSGAPLLSLPPTVVPITYAGRAGLVYAAGPARSSVALSSEDSSRLWNSPQCREAAAGTFIPPNRCCFETTGAPAPLAPMAVLDPTTLGFVPPFSIGEP